MRISVAMATYNGEKFIIEQLESIRMQTKQVDEVIISDDNSTDNTRQLVEGYIARYGLVDTWRVVNNKGKGISENFYNAIKETTGDIIFLCDQDDIWHEEKVEKIWTAFDCNKHIKCINSSFWYIDIFSKVIPYVENVNKANNDLILHSIGIDQIEPIPLPLVLYKNISPGMTMAFTREIAQLFLSISSKKLIHDWEINCLAAAVGGLFYLNTKLSYYRIHHKQAVSIGNIKKRTIFTVAKEKIEKDSEKVRIETLMLNELKRVVQSKKERCFIEDALTLHNIRIEVVTEKKLYKWIKEVSLFLKNSQKYGYLDIRYCGIDLLAGVCNCFK